MYILEAARVMYSLSVATDPDSECESAITLATLISEDSTLRNEYALAQLSYLFTGHASTALERSVVNRAIGKLSDQNRAMLNVELAVLEHDAIYGKVDERLSIAFTLDMAIDGSGA